MALYAGAATPGHADGPRLAGALFDRPHGLCLDKDGNVFVAETQSATVRRIDSKTGSMGAAERGRFHRCCAVVPKHNAQPTQTTRLQGW